MLVHGQREDLLCGDLDLASWNGVDPPPMRGKGPFIVVLYRLAYSTPVPL